MNRLALKDWAEEGSMVYYHSTSQQNSGVLLSQRLKDNSNQRGILVFGQGPYLSTNVESKHNNFVDEVQSSYRSSETFIWRQLSDDEEVWDHVKNFFLKSMHCATVRSCKDGTNCRQPTKLKF